MTPRKSLILAGGAGFIGSNFGFDGLTHALGWQNGYVQGKFGALYVM
jgi:hypothetical protein